MPSSMVFVVVMCMLCWMAEMFPFNRHWTTRSSWSLSSINSKASAQKSTMVLLVQVDEKKSRWIGIRIGLKFNSVGIYMFMGRESINLHRFVKGLNIFASSLPTSLTRICPDFQLCGTESLSDRSKITTASSSPTFGQIERLNSLMQFWTIPSHILIEDYDPGFTMLG